MNERLLLVFCLLFVPAAHAASDPFGDISFDQSNLGEQVPLDLKFENAQGEDVTLGGLLGDRPAILMLVYYDCPMLCSVAMDELVKTLRVMDFSVGKEFDVITVSFDPFENPAQALRRRATMIKRYRRENTAAGWSFLTARGDKSTIDRLTNSVGFNYAFDEKTQRYSHAAGIVILTPDGRISRYLEGIEHNPRDVEASLFEASGGKIGSVTKKLILRCYVYDPSIGKYGLRIHRGIQIFGTLTALTLGGAIVVLLRRERRSRKDGSGASSEAEPPAERDTTASHLA